MIKGIHHPSFYINNMDEALHFYSDILGFKYSHGINNDKGEPWILFLKVKEGQYMELFYGGEKRSLEDSKAGYAHLCFEVEDIQGLMKHLESNKVFPETEVKRAKDGSLYCFVRDPEGNRVEFKQF